MHLVRNSTPAATSINTYADVAHARVLDAAAERGQITSMAARANLYFALGLIAFFAGCRDRQPDKADSSRSLPPVYPSSPLESTNWDRDAGPLMVVADTAGPERARVVLPEATDSTIESFEGVNPPIEGLKFDLFGRGGRQRSSAVLSPLPRVNTRDQCYAWPRARVHGPTSEWRVGLASGRTSAIRLDSIEGRSSSDSAALAVALTQTAATLPAATDPAFRGLPFRVRSAYTFRLGSVEVVVADVVRTVNEEANPRVERLFIIGERGAGTTSKYEPGYYSRTAGAEDSIEATELLTALEIGPAKRPTVVVSIEYDDGGKIALIERTAPGRWTARWRSAYTDC